MDEIRKVPPFTRTVVLGVILTTLPVILHLVSPYAVAFVPHRVANNWELHRLVLPFLFGGGGIQLVFSLIMLFRSLKELEEGHFASRLADMTWAFVLICAGIIGLNTPLQNPWLFAPFNLAIIHLWAQTNAMHQVNLYGILTLPAPYFPWAMLAMDLLQGGPGAALRSFTGMVAAHAYFFAAVIYPRQNNNRLPALVSSLLSPPQLLINALGNGAAVPSSFAASSPSGTSSYRTAFGTAFRPSAAGAGGRTLGGAPGGGGGGPAAPAGRGAAGSSTAVRGAGAAGGGAGGERTAQHRWGSGQRLGSD
ncbi:Der1-like family-domain-containing protein [Rhodotorula diobovata]|uniref:Derlin n=1 Tax=Rhodotorula diobovata TaxID=5288 RepID=A0A5C5G514_9BASI|nr:Der1-like family-domain-containing protein [Rhodotorula diobovata]